MQPVRLVYPVTSDYVEIEATFVNTAFLDAHSKKTKCPKKKRSKAKHPSDKTDKTSQGTKHPKGTNEAHYLTWCGQLTIP